MKLDAAGLLTPWKTLVDVCIKCLKAWDVVAEHRRTREDQIRERLIFKLPIASSVNCIVQITSGCHQCNQTSKERSCICEALLASGR